MTKDDMSYNEIVEIKENIQAFTKYLSEFSKTQGFDCKQCDTDFFKNISKHIIFFKNLYNQLEDQYYYKVIISDMYYLMLSIIKNETRYIYVNERSIIENYMRAILQESVHKNHITADLFDLLKQKYTSNIQNDEFSLIKSEYISCCQFIHGAEILNNNLSYTFKDCVLEKNRFKDRNKYFDRIRRILKTYDKILVCANSVYVNNVFHRRKSLIKYLLDEECVELLFK